MLLLFSTFNLLTDDNKNQIEMKNKKRKSKRHRVILFWHHTREAEIIK